MNAPSLIIFDCDGVLVDSEQIANRILVQALSEKGIVLTYEEVVDQFVGRSLKVFEQTIQNRFGIALDKTFFQELDRRTYEAFEKELQPVNGIKEALAKIKYAKCVASSGDHKKIRKTLGLTGLLSQFEPNIFSASDVAEGKPAPDLFLYAAKKMNANPANCLVIEDSIYGVQAGCAAQMTVFAYANGHDPKALANAGAKLVFDDMRKLPDLIARQL